MPTYTFSTGVPNIQPAVYAAGTTTPDLNVSDVVTDADGVLTLTLDAGDYYAQWRWEGDTRQASGEVANPAGVQSLGELSTSGGSSPVAVFAEYTGSLDAAALAALTYYSLTVADDDGTGWDVTAPTTLLPPQNGRYRVSVAAYATGTLDAPAEIRVGKTGGSTQASAAVPTGATGIYAGNVTAEVSISDHTSEGIRVQGAYSDSAPTTGGVDVTVYVSRIGDLP